MKGGARERGDVDPGLPGGVERAERGKVRRSVVREVQDLEGKGGPRVEMRVGDAKDRRAALRGAVGGAILSSVTGLRRIPR
jgi:hypothetical protein